MKCVLQVKCKRSGHFVGKWMGGKGSGVLWIIRSRVDPLFGKPPLILPLLGKSCAAPTTMLT